MKKKGQAAMEFLMTYGWAILVVLAVIGALAYFGVLSPSNLLPEKCTFPVSFSCSDHEVGSNGVKVTFQNSGGKDVKITSVTFTSDALNELSGNCSTGAISAVVKNGAQATFYGTDPLNCEFKDTGRQKNRYTILVNYQSLDSAITHTATGELLAQGGSSTISGESGSYGGGSGDTSLTGYWGLNEGSGTQAADISSSGNTGTLTNFACTTLDCNPSSGWTSSGKSGNAILFDGVDDTVNLGNNAAIKPASAVTVEAWVYPTAIEPRIAVGAGDATHGAGWTIGMGYSQVEFNLNTVGGSTTHIGGRWDSLDTNVWTHLAFTYDSATSTATLYKNGAPILTDTTSLAGSIYYDASPVRISQLNGYVPLDYWQGKIDKVKVWNRALTAPEIQAEFSAG